MDSRRPASHGGRHRTVTALTNATDGDGMQGRIPQWLYSALDDALVGVGASAGPGARRALIDDMISAWNEDDRSFYNCRYLAYVLERVDELEGTTSEADLLRLAVAYRGIRGEMGWEESRPPNQITISLAALRAEELLDLGVNAEQVTRIQALVEQLANHTPVPGDLSAYILVDADLALLASPPQQYRDFLSLLRRQASQMSDEEFLRSRRELITTLLERPRIFSTPLASQWENAAHENLEAELSGITAKLARLEGPSGGMWSQEDRTDQSRPSRDGARLPARNAPDDQGGVGGGERPGEGGQHDPQHRPSRVLRISRAQKLARLNGERDEYEDDLPYGRLPSVTDTWTGEGDGKETGASARTRPRRIRDDSGAGSDTSTLESVADLIEGHRSHKRDTRA